MKKKPSIKPRNPYVKEMRFKKAGAHTDKWEKRERNKLIKFLKEELELTEELEKIRSSEEDPPQ